MIMMRGEIAGQRGAAMSARAGPKVASRLDKGKTTPARANESRVNVGQRKEGKERWSWV